VFSTVEPDEKSKKVHSSGYSRGFSGNLSKTFGGEMKRIILATSATIVLALSCAIQLTGASGHPTGTSMQSNEFHWRKQLAPGRLIEIKGINGSVHAEPATGNEVEVVAEKSSKRDDVNSVTIETVEHADGITICAVYPSRDVEKPNVCAPGAGGRMSVQNNDVTVTFTVRVPAGVRFAGRTVNGGVDASELAADVDARTVNGSVNISTTGLARAETVNGSITARMGNASWADNLQFKTVNGKVDVSFPATLSAQVDAETVNGDIQSDFPITVTGRVSKRKLNGTIGGGGRELHLRTVNGDVVIRRAS
jgi:hypothetical protein